MDTSSRIPSVIKEEEKTMVLVGREERGKEGRRGGKKRGEGRRGVWVHTGSSSTPICSEKVYLLLRAQSYTYCCNIICLSSSGCGPL